MRLSWRVVLGLGVCLSACASGPSRPQERPASPQHDISAAAAQASRRTTDLHTVQIRVIGVDAAGSPVLTASSDFELQRAGQFAFAQGAFAEALTHWQRLLAEFPDSALAPNALWNVAAAHEALADGEAAIATLLRVAERYPADPLAFEALVLAGALRADEHDWTSSLSLLARAHAWPGQSYAQRIEVAARTGLAHFRRGELDQADAAFATALADARRLPALPDPYFVAMTHYYSGMTQLARLDQERLGADTAAQMSAAVDRYEAAAARAYDTFLLALKFSVPYWATAAGYQMSALHQRLFRLFKEAPVPTDVAAGARTYYSQDLATRTRRHLEIARDGHAANLRLGLAFGASNEWTAASEAAMAELNRELGLGLRGEQLGM